MKCYYHTSDLDGRCSGAIVKHYERDCELVPIDYGYKSNLKHLRDEIVYMVDFTLEPFSRMIDLDKRTDLVWIDHHKSAIDEAKKRGFDPMGLRDCRYAACELTWKYCFPNKDIPFGVSLLGRYDVWDHQWLMQGDRSVVLMFQYGMRILDTDPSSQIWSKILECDDLFIDQVTTTGRAVAQYVEIDNERYAHGYSFTTEFEGYNCICCNRGMTNSKLFDTIWDEKSHDLMVTFCRTRNALWLVHLYTTHRAVDCGAIAKRHGGGGHQKAAGFRCKNLPFRI